jgi:phosphohistidine phosphatase
MKLYLLRHGDAGERDASSYTSDAARALTPKGIKRTRELAKFLKAAEVHFDTILSSPLIRAHQTAEIIAEELGMEKELRFVSELAPDHALTEVVALLASAPAKTEAMLLVGHEPGLSRLISLLCTGGANLSLTLKKGGLCRLDLGEVKSGPCAALEWLLTPRHFSS